jgi:hypothetical protein
VDRQQAGGLVGGHMLTLAMIALGAVTFAAMFGLVVFCDRV